MTSPVSSASHSLHVQAAPLSLLLDIPRDVVPNIYTRLPGSDLLRLAQACNQLRTTLKDQVRQELRDIGSLNGEPLWTRLLDLVAQYGHLIDSEAWANFQSAAASQDDGHPMLLLMATQSFERVEKNECLATLPQPAALDFSPKEYADLHTLVREAGKEPWKGRAGAAAIAGQWRHAVRFGKDVDWLTLTSLIRLLPLSNQIRIMPCLEGHDSHNLRLLDAHARLTRNHSYQLLFSAGAQSPLPALATASLAYLLCLGKMFGSHANTSDHCQGRRQLRQVVSGSLAVGMPLGAWRQEPPELALLVLLALHWDPENQALATGLGKQLLDCGFINRPEYTHLVKFLAKASGDKMDRARQWLALNRDKQAAIESESICAIS